jgi:hypothetical protein
MPWLPEFVTAVELARRQTREAGEADPVGLYVTALNRGDADRRRASPSTSAVRTACSPRSASTTTSNHPPTPEADPAM